MRPLYRSPLLVLLLVAASTTSAFAGDTAEVARIEAVLNDFHAAAAVADEVRYFGHLAPGSVFLGTDATERWTKSEFRAFVHPYFARGQGWTYTPVRRYVSLAADGKTAWFDEALDSASYGECRGSGALQLHADGWKIEQYNLTFLIPNEIAKQVVAQIRALGSDEAGDEGNVDVDGDR